MYKCESEERGGGGGSFAGNLRERLVWITAGRVCTFTVKSYKLPAIAKVLKACERRVFLLWMTLLETDENASFDESERAVLRTGTVLLLAEMTLQERMAASAVTGEVAKRVVMLIWIIV